METRIFHSCGLFSNLDLESADRSRFGLGMHPEPRPFTARNRVAGRTGSLGQDEVDVRETTGRHVYGKLIMAAGRHLIPCRRLDREHAVTGLHRGEEEAAVWSGLRGLRAVSGWSSCRMACPSKGRPSSVIVPPT